MSFILDALKKSEENRSENQPLKAEKHVLIPHLPAKKRHALIFICIFIPLVSLILGWWIGRHPEPQASSIAMVENQRETSVTRQVTAPTPLPRQSVSQEPKASKPVNQGYKPTDSKEVKPSSIAAPVPQRIQEAPLQPTSFAQSKMTAESSTVTTSGTETEQKAVIPYYDELPESLQRDIPELTLSLHFFSSDPARRMLRVNGKIRHENEIISTGLSITEIRETASLLNYRGTLFLLPAPGQ